MESWMFSFHPRPTCLHLSKELVDARAKMDRELKRYSNSTLKFYKRNWKGFFGPFFVIFVDDI